MNEKYLLSRIAQKHDIETNWNNAVDFIPMRGELIVYDIDANYDYERLKIGDGATTVVDLPFVNEKEFFSLQQKIDKIIDNGIFKKEFEEKNLIYFWDFRTGSLVD